ncbi:Alcohol acetyltransferase [Penicillium griseofulvum]|uniref:Alcohol acetyltransferase n=1 Tax=Penicillium patulum TaxID=5078 RepID=A0A135LMK4_PENPA|nr:Alcohol acetyltransferase [Penicillium griseofulvum]KXG50185.1 Alcohol acetyltransferase [Penicillium griseofulvum]
MEGGFHEGGFTPLRPLGHAEKYSTTRSSLAIYLNVGLTALYKRPDGVPVKPALLHALSTLISKHPILSAIPVATDTPNPYFVRLPKIILNEVVTFIKHDVTSPSSDWSETLDKVLEEEHNHPFEVKPNTTLPFWRFCVLESSNCPESFGLVFMFHHSLMDTKSALSLHDELEGYMAQYSGPVPSDTVYSPSLDLIPSLEDLYGLPVSQKFLQSQESYTEPSPDSWTGAVQFRPVKTRFASLWLSEVETKGLIARSKKERTSVTAALQALIATCIFSVLPSTYNTLQGDCAVSLRQFLPEPVTASTLGCYVGSTSTTYHRKSSFDWGEARRTKVDIENAMAQKGSDMSVGYLAFIPNQHQWMLQKLGRKRMSAFELSNIGSSFSSREASKFQCEGMLFSQSSSACSGAMKVSAVTGRDGKLALGFTWQQGAVEADMVEGIKRALKGEIERLAVSA